MLTTHLNFAHACRICIRDTRLHIALQYLTARLATKLGPWSETDERSSLGHTITNGQWELDPTQERLYFCVQRRTTNNDL